MRWASVMAARLRGLFGGERADRELDDEVQFHLEMQAEDNIRAGMNPVAARRAAARNFGGMEPMKEAYRERRSFTLIETMARDLRFSARALWKSPGFTLTAAAVLSLAIGATTAVFSVLDAVLLQPLPYRSPEQLAMLWAEDPSRNFREGRSALWDVEQWRSQAESFSDLATFDSLATFLTGPDGVEQIAGASISPNLLPLLGIQPLLGRNFSNEEADQRQALVLISYEFWQSRLGGRQDVPGTKLVLNGNPYQVIGILPAGFRVARTAADVWEAHSSRQSVRLRESWSVIGRLRQGISLGRAQAEMRSVAQRLSQQMPAAAKNRTVRVDPLGNYLAGPRLRLGLWLLGGAVFFVFLIAAANVTSLSLARSTARGSEMAIRAALGASGGRIVLQLLTESMLLALFSGAIGLLLAVGGIDLIRTFGPADLPRLNEVQLDLRVLGCAAAITALTAVLVGLAPVAGALRRDLRPSASEGGRSVSGGTATRRIRGALVIADFALAIVLLAGAGLLTRSWWQVSGVDPGFRPERVVTMELSAPISLSVPAKLQLYERMLEAIRTIPGVESAGLMGELFVSNNREQDVTVERGEGAVSDRLTFVREEVGGDLFQALGTRLLRGRFFTAADTPDVPLVAIINETMARRSWPGQDAVGKRFKVGARDADVPWYTVTGVVADIRRQGPEIDPIPQMFVPLTQASPPRNMDLFIRTASGDPAAMAGAFRAAIRGVEKNAPVSAVSLLEQQFGVYLAQRRFQTSLLIGFSVIALLMAAIGIYGLIQYSISARTQEIGIRMAVGADAGSIFRMILGEGMKLSISGLLIGLAGALGLGQAAAGLLFGVTPTDPSTLAAVSVVLLAVAAAACYLPARRAMKIEPVAALRQT